jgi:hypothetical protein
MIEVVMSMVGLGALFSHLLGILFPFLVPLIAAIIFFFGTRQP